MIHIAWSGKRNSRLDTKPPPNIIGYRQAEHADLPTLERLIGSKTRDVFGDVSLGRIYEEDNDDVVPIINAASTKLQELYGKYYISEMIRHPDGHRQLIVSEDENGIAIGVMCLSDVVDVDLLNETFELVPYNGLKKPHQFDKITPDVLKSISDITDCLVSEASKIAVGRECIERKTGVDLLEGYTGEADANEQTLANSKTSRASSINDIEEKHNEGYPKEPNSDPKKRRRVRIKSTDSSGIEKAVENFSETKHLQFPPVQKSSAIVSSDQYVFLNEQIGRTSSVLSKEFLDDSNTTLLAGSRSTNRESISMDNLSSSPPGTSVADVLKSDSISPQSLEDIFIWPQYYGENNAFVLEIFAMEKEICQRRSRDFLEAAFECFPDLDYCVMLTPSTQPALPISQYFMHVPLRCNRDFPMTLYLAHRTMHLDDIITRLAVVDDRVALKSFLDGLSNREAVLEDFNEATNCLHGRKHCHIFQYNGAIIGVSIVSFENNPDDLSKRYHVEDYISKQYVPSDEYGRLLHFTLMPIFSIHQRYFLREIMRVCSVTVLYYQLYDTDRTALTRMCSLPACLTSMTPIRPRCRTEYALSSCPCNAKEETFRRDGRCCGDQLFSLFITTPRLVTTHYPTINTKIVVVGASDCGVALAEYLTLCSSYNSAQFTNVTIVSPNGLPYEKKHRDSATKMIPFKGTYCHEYRHLVPDRLWINVVCGSVVAINRTLSASDTPWNCITVTNDIEASNCLEKIGLLSENLTLKKKIVLYGHNIDCYCALTGLLEFGVNGSWITLIEPELDLRENHDHVFFNDCEVDKAVMNEVMSRGIEIFSGWTIVGWDVEEASEGKIIRSIVLKSKAETTSIACDALLNFDKRTVDTTTFLAISRAGLVFDEQLIIDAEFRTNDPFIYAAGTMTKYSRKYHADSWQHKYYNPIEIGERLGQIIRRLLIDKHEGEENSKIGLPKDKIYRTLPVFRAPTIISCTLPGGYHYLHVRKPGRRILRKVAIAHGFYGTVLTTGSCTSESGYFRLRLNDYDSVETITCYSKKALNASVLTLAQTTSHFDAGSFLPKGLCRKCSYANSPYMISELKGTWQKPFLTSNTAMLRIVSRNRVK